MQLLTQSFLNILLWFYQLTGNLGVAIIVMTVIIRLVLVPLSIPSHKARNKMQELQPELKKLKEKHGKNKQAYQQAQLDLYKKYNVNPLAGCIPQLVQIAILIFLYNAMMNFLGQTSVNGININSHFLWLNLSLPDNKFVLPVLAGVTQLILSLMIAPGAEVRDVVPNKAKNKKIKQDNKQEEDVADMAATMQKQMIFFMPIMTGFIALRFPSGLALYWVATTIFSIGQQYALSGWGGLKIYTLRAVQLVIKK